MVSATWLASFTLRHIMLYVAAAINWRRWHRCRGAVADIKRADCPSASARANVRQRVGRGRGKPKAASMLSARWRLGAVTTFIDTSRLQWLRCGVRFWSLSAYCPRLYLGLPLGVANRNLTFECQLPLTETGHGLRNRLSG